MERQVTLAARVHDGSWPAPFSRLADERLGRLVASGHERAFAVVYERYHQPLYRYCRSILRDDADAQDALQSTFAAAFAALRRGHRDAPLRPWLFRIAHNESVSILRRRRPSAELSTADVQAAQGVEDQVVDRAELSVLLEDLRELAERQRSALVMRELSGLSHQDIATALGTSVGAAKQTIFEARRSLFEFAEGRAMACDEIRRMISDADGRALRGRRVRAHLRGCRSCAAFAAAIPARGTELRALVPPLPALAAAGLLERIVGTAHAGGGGAGVTNLALGAAAKGAAAGTSAGFGANALAGIAVVATATVGVTVGVNRIISAPSQTGKAHALSPAAAPGSSSRGGAPSTALLIAPALRASHAPAGLVRVSGPAPASALRRQSPPPDRGAAATRSAAAPAAAERANRGPTTPAPKADPRGGAAGRAVGRGNHGVSAAGHSQGAGPASQSGSAPGRSRGAANAQTNHGPSQASRSGHSTPPGPHGQSPHQSAGPAGGPRAQGAASPAAPAALPTIAPPGPPAGSGLSAAQGAQGAHTPSTPPGSPAGPAAANSHAG
jgi:RNA polymerase sigma factor (sigma-70 family)